MNKSQIGMLEAQLRCANRKWEEAAANGNLESLEKLRKCIDYMAEKVKYYKEEQRMKKERMERIFANEFHYLKGRIEAAEKEDNALPHSKEYYEGAYAALLTVFDALEREE